MMSIRAGVLVGIVASLILFFFGPLISNEGLAFAEVQAQVEQVRTVEYIETSYDGDAPSDSKAGSTVSFAVPPGTTEPTVAETITRLEGSLQNASGDLVRNIQFELNVLRSLQAAKVEIVRRVRIKGKHLERTDQLFPHATQNYTSPSYWVCNAHTGLTVYFKPSEKKKTVLTQQVVINRNTGEASKRDIQKIPLTVDFFARFRDIPVEATETLPTTKIDDREVIGFRSVETHGDETWTRTYWVAPGSKLPIEIVTERRKEQTLLQRSVQNQFVFDHELQDELFSTETPEGYHSEDGKVQGGYGPE